MSLSYDYQMEDWTEKYRPKSLDDIYGNDRAIGIIKRWANNWKVGKIPKRRAIIFIGKPGIGKTSSAFAVANDFGWKAIELNASDARNASKIKKVATLGALNETFDDFGRFIPSREGGRKLIILDEADNLYEKIDQSPNTGDLSDRGGKKAIIDTIKITNQPIILIVNNYYKLIKGSGEVLKRLCEIVQFYDVNSSQIVDLLKKICLEENITVDIKLLKNIADRCKGDIRSALNDLQSISLNRTNIDIQSIDVLGYRDREKIIFDALRDIFKSKTIQTMKDNRNELDIPPETFLLWINENLPREYLDTSDLTRGYESLSKADIFFGRVFKRQYYGLWSYAFELMNGGVSIAKTHNYGNMKYFPPVWIKEMSKSKSTRVIRDSILKKLGCFCHMSSKKGKETLFTNFRYLFQNNLVFAGKTTIDLDLSESEVKYLLGEKYSVRFKDIMQLAEKKDDFQIEIKVPSEDTDIKEEKKDRQQEIKQPSIFDF